MCESKILMRGIKHSITKNITLLPTIANGHMNVIIVDYDFENKMLMHLLVSVLCPTNIADDFEIFEGTKFCNQLN